MLILLPVDVELKASIALIQASTSLLSLLSFTKNNFKIAREIKNSSMRFPRVSGCEVSCCSVPVFPVATQLTGLFPLPTNKTPSQVHRGEGSQVKFKYKKELVAMLLW